MIVLLKKVVVGVAFVLVLLVAILGTMFFWNVTDKNQSWCRAKSEYCTLARLSYQKEVAQKVADLSK